MSRCKHNTNEGLSKANNHGQRTQTKSHVCFIASLKHETEERLRKEKREEKRKNGERVKKVERTEWRRGERREKGEKVGKREREREGRKEK